jgi:hypothetical protein
MERSAVTLWEVDIHPAAGQPDLLARSVASEAADLGLGKFEVQAARGFLVQGEISREEIERLSRELLTDLVVETPVVGRPGEAILADVASGGRQPAEASRESSGGSRPPLARPDGPASLLRALTASGACRCSPAGTG